MPSVIQLQRAVEKMPRIFYGVILFFSCVFIFGNIASAYDITINVHEKLAVGQPLIVTGTSNYPDLTAILYKVTTTSAREISRATCNSHREQSPASFDCRLSTDGLESGLYKVDVIPSGQKDGSKFSSDSIYQKHIQLTVGSGQESTVTPMATEAPTQAVITSVSTLVSMPSTVRSLSATAIPTPGPTLLSPTDNPSPAPTVVPAPEPTPPLSNNGDLQPGLTAIVSLFISLAGFGVIEYSVLYWQDKKRK